MPDGAEEAARAAATHLVQQMPRGCDGGVPFAGIAMCDQDDAWGESRHFSERNMAELYTEEPAPSPSSGRGPEEWQWPGRRPWRASTLQTKWTRPRIGAGIRS